MEVARRYLSVPVEEYEKVSRMVVPPRKAGAFPSFYVNFSLRGLQIHRSELYFQGPSPPHRQDRSGNLATGAIANLVDEIGYAAVYVEGTPMSVSVNTSLSYLSPAKAHDELVITSKALGQRGRYSRTLVVLKNKRSGEVVAEGRHSLFSAHASKIYLTTQLMDGSPARSVDALGLIPCGSSSSFFWGDDAAIPD